MVRQQASTIVARLLAADGANRGHVRGASIKTLTLAPGVAAKKATHAVVCETLRHIPLLRLVLDAAAAAAVAENDDVLLRRINRSHRRRRVQDDEVHAGDGEDDEVDEDGGEEEEEEEDGEEEVDERETDGEEEDELGEDEDGAGGAVPRSMAYVLAYELLFGAGIDDASPEDTRSSVPEAERVMVGLKKPMALALKRTLRAHKVPDAESFLLAQPGGRALASVPSHSRHARVNTLKTTLEAAERSLARLKPTRDPHVPNLLVFPPGTDLHAHPMVRDGRLVLQGKASCLPAAALAPNRGWHVVDCCAAPGNKTTHLAAHVGATGRVYAFDAVGMASRVVRGGRSRCVNARDGGEDGFPTFFFFFFWFFLLARDSNAREQPAASFHRPIIRFNTRP